MVVKQKRKINPFLIFPERRGVFEELPRGWGGGAHVFQVRCCRRLSEDKNPEHNYPIKTPIGCPDTAERLIFSVAGFEKARKLSPKKNLKKLKIKKNDQHLQGKRQN